MQRGGSLRDGVLQDRISGEVGWQQKSYPLSGDGTHALVWVYSKDSNDTGGSDRGWVDYLQWTPSGGGGGGSSTTDWEQITYTYDPSGRRIAKDVDGEVTKYVYDGDQCIAEYDANDVLLRKYIHGPCIDEPICMIEAAGGYAGTYYYHFDALGSVVALSDADGDTVQVYEYDVYGQVAASDPNHPNRFLFTGREFDKETGLYYYRARYYNPAIGRFLQTDPIGYADGMNLYCYCRNNSWNLTDRYGLDSTDPNCDAEEKAFQEAFDNWVDAANALSAAELRAAAALTALQRTAIALNVAVVAAEAATGLMVIACKGILKKVSPACLLAIGAALSAYATVQLLRIELEEKTSELLAAKIDLAVARRAEKRAYKKLDQASWMLEKCMRREDTH